MGAGAGFRDTFKVLDYDLTSPMRGGVKFDWAEHAYRVLQKQTEAYFRQALEKGAGWNVWRSEPRMKDDDPFVIVHDFALVPPGANAPGRGYLFRQPDLTDGERARLLAGRHDWEEHRWQDECGVPDCGHPSCERYRA